MSTSIRPLLILLCSSALAVSLSAAESWTELLSRSREASQQRDWERAEQLARLALERAEQDEQPPAAGVASCLHALATVHLQNRKPVEAIPLYERALAIQERVHGADDPALFVTVNNLGLVYRITRQTSKAAAAYVRALDLQERRGDEGIALLPALTLAADTSHADGAHVEAIGFYERILDLIEQPEPDDRTLPTALDRLAKSLVALDRHEEALPHLRRLREILSEHPAANQDAALSVAQRLGDSLIALKDYAAAEPLFKGMQERLVEQYGPGDERVADVLDRLADIARATDRPDLARERAEQATAIRENGDATGAGDF